MKFMTGQTGQGMVEWLVVVVIIVALVGAILITLFTTLSAKLTGVNDAL